MCNLDLDLADVVHQTGLFRALAANYPGPVERRQGGDLFLRMPELTLRRNAPHLTGPPSVDRDGEPHAASFGRAAEEGSG